MLDTTTERLPHGSEQSVSAMLLQALESNRFGISLADATQPDMPLIYVNRAFEDITGFARDEALGRNCRFLQGPETDPDAIRRVADTLRQEQSGSFLLLNYRKDGSRFWNRCQLSPLHDSNGRLTSYMGMQIDLSNDIDRTRLEIDRQKVETLGRLAGGVAHEINNALQPIRLFAETLSDGPDISPATFSRCVGGILEGAVLAQSLTDQILAFARSDRPKAEPHNASQAIAQAVDFASDLIPSSISVERLGFDDPDLSTAEIRLNRTDILQVVANLFTNARDAMSNSGRIEVRLGRETRPDGANWITMTVSDTGTGIDPAVHRRIFEPFFTTKPAGRGTGLGLPTILAIVRGWGGSIELDGGCNKGASFTVAIPQSRPGVK